MEPRDGALGDGAGGGQGCQIGGAQMIRRAEDCHVGVMETQSSPRVNAHPFQPVWTGEHSGATMTLSPRGLGDSREILRVTDVGPSLTFNELRLTSKLCDAIFRVEGEQFPVHKIIMCGCSQYFRSMFVDWDRPQQTVFTIRGVSADMMRRIIDFAYTGSVALSRDTVMELTITADYFNVCELLTLCSDFLHDQLNLDTCIEIWLFTKTCHLPDLHAAALRFICTHYTEVALQEQFLLLDVQDLALLLDREDLDAAQESVVFESVMRWTCTLEERRGSLSTLLSKVRLELMMIQYIVDNVLTNQLVTTDPECHAMVLRAIQTICQLVIRQSEPGICKSLCRPRLPNALLLATGGQNRSQLMNTIEIYDYTLDCWTSVPTCSTMRPVARHGSAFLDGHVYIVGGMSRRETLNTVCRFNPVDFTWQEVSPMHERRCEVSVCILNGSLYALGGINGSTRSRTAERYDPRTNQWTLIAPMNTERSDASCVALDNRLYICGGFSGDEILRSAECYDPDADRWTTITPMTTRRTGLGVAVFMDQIFAVGGFNGVQRVSSVEAYNPRTNSWHQVRSLAQGRSHFGIDVVDTRLYVVGGSFEDVTAHVERLDPETLTWSSFSSMETPRNGLSCCVIRGLSNMADYCTPRDTLPLGPRPEDQGGRQSS